MTATELPDFLTVEEAAKLLRIGRTAAYQLARMWRGSKGTRGIPVVTFGRLLRVPRTALEAMVTNQLADPDSAACAVCGRPRTSQLSA